MFGVTLASLEWHLLGASAYEPSSWELFSAVLPELNSAFPDPGEAHIARCSIGKLLSCLSKDGFYVIPVTSTDILENSLRRFSSFRQVYEFLLPKID